MAFCFSCGKEMEAGGKFCHHCGTPAATTGENAGLQSVGVIKAKKKKTSSGAKWAMGGLAVIIGAIVIVLNLVYEKYEDKQTGKLIEAYESENSWLYITTTPDDAIVTLLNRPKSYHLPMRIGVGLCKIRVSKPGYIPQEKRFMVIKKRIKRITVDLELKVPPGHLYVSTNPSDAVVRILNIKPLFSPDMALEPGRYHLSVSRAGYETKNEWITLTKNKGYAADITLKPIGTINNILGMEFSYIKPGNFMMGTPSGEHGRQEYETRHRVTLTQGYYLQTTEVTQGQWKAVMGSNPSKFFGDNCPVEQVSWDDAQSFIQKLNAREGGTHYRLPTEAEWEFACRAGSDTPYANGKSLSSLGWYFANSVRMKTHPVAGKSQNDWGLYDMHGNVEEWCQDWFFDYYSGNATNPAGPSMGSIRVIRGGSWQSTVGYVSSCRSASRSFTSPGHRSCDLGFRLARTP